jgi:hypothetical protein
MSRERPSPLAVDASTPQSDGRDRVRWIRGAEALDADVISVLTRPAMSGRFWVDLENARRWLEERRGEGNREGMTYTHLFAKAAGLAAMASPDLHRMYGWFRCVDPGAADVGVSVASEGVLAPVIVLEAADRMSLREIARGLREKAAQVRRDDPQTRKLADRLAPLVPPFVRRFLIRLVFSSPGLRRRMVGTIQVTNIGLAEAEDCQVPMAAEVVLGCGVVEKRVVPDENDRAVVRTGAMFTLNASHRKLTAVTARPFIERFRALLARPEELASDSGREADRNLRT